MKDLGIRFINEMSAGSGDFPDVASDSMIHIRDLKQLNRTPECVLGAEDVFGDLFVDNRSILDFEVKPGFFYVGDKEYHLYSEKCTEVEYLEQGQLEMKLKGYPNGYSHIGLYGPFEESEFTGVFYDELIDKKKSMHSLYLNEANRFVSAILDESGFPTGVQLCDFDTSGFYPLCFTPFHPLAQCYTYWERDGKCKPINYLRYDFDLFTNSIVRVPSSQNDPLPEGYFIAEYERTTLKTLTGSNWNPIAKRIDEGFLLLSPQTEDQTLDRVNILSISEPTSQNRQIISFEARNFQSNVIKNTAVTIRIVRNFLNELDVPIEASIQEFNEYYSLYTLDNPQPDEHQLYEKGVLLKSVAANQEEMILRTEGLISEQDEGPFLTEITVPISEDGIGIIHFQGPVLEGPEFEVTLQFAFGSMDLGSYEIRNNNSIDQPSRIHAPDNNFTYEVHPVERLNSNQARLNIENLKTMSNIEVYSILNYMRYSTQGLNLRPVEIVDRNIVGNIVSLDIRMQANEGDYVVVRTFNASPNYIKLDSSFVYGL